MDWLGDFTLWPYRSSYLHLQWFALYQVYSSANICAVTVCEAYSVLSTISIEQQLISIRKEKCLKYFSIDFTLFIYYKFQFRLNQTFKC